MKYFKTDGIRGKVNEELTVELALSVGKALKVLKPKKVVIGYDTRESNKMLMHAISSGANSIGIDTIEIGIISTGGLAYLSYMYQCVGVMITASHNPYFDNGIKVFNHGYKLTVDEENKIEFFMQKVRPFDGKVGRHTINTRIKNKYIDFIKMYMVKTKKKIVIDAANGSNYKNAKTIYESISNDLIVIGNKPNGININDNVGALHLDTIKSIIRNNKYDIGFAFDGDADRLIVIDEECNVYKGDELLYIFANFYKYKISSNKIVMTNTTNLGVIQSFINNGFEVELTSTGDRNVLYQMIRSNALIGGESSGHIILLNYLMTGDGLLNSILLLGILEKTKKSLKELTKGLRKYPEKSINLKMNKSIVDEQKVIDYVNKYNNDELKLIVRASGTEDLVRIYCSSEKEEKIDEAINGLLKIIDEY